METRAPLIEICVETADHAVAAEMGGAARIELCTALTEGGVTPSSGLFARVLSELAIPVFVLVRPRRGDFLYTPRERDVLLDDVRRFRDAGAHGIVTGGLTADGAVDRELMAAVIDRAGALPVTFHRAFDHLRDPSAALETLVELGVKRILTSGGREAVRDGLAGIHALVIQAAGRIGILPGGGVRPEHVGEILRETAVTELHASASFWVRSPAEHQPSCALAGVAPSEYDVRSVTRESVEAFVRAARGGP